MYSAYSIANAFIERALARRIPDLSSMKLQKLMYFAQAHHLKRWGRPLFEDTFTRGRFGPMLPSILHQVKAYGTRPITQTIRALSGDNDRDNWCTPTLPSKHVDAHHFIDQITGLYGGRSAQALSDLTHLPGSAWSHGGADGSPISNAMIRNDPTLSGQFNV